MLVIHKDPTDHKNCHPKKLHMIESSKIRSGVITAATILLISGNNVQITMAAPFDPAFEDYLTEVCKQGNLGSNLGNVCTRFKPASGAVGSISLPSSPESTGARGLEQRLQSFRESEEEHLENESRKAYAMNTNERFAQGNALQLPPAVGATPDIVFGLGSGASVFLSAGAYALNHYNNRFEDGYEAQLPTVTVGADYRINDWMLAGLAFNYTNYDGTYDDGGGFDKHIFGPLLYATFLPFDGAFANVVLGYARQENRNNRLANASTAGATAPVPVGHTSADYSENQYTAGVLAGYDQPFGNVTIGPRLGLAFSHESFNNIKEDGDTGLELRYNNLNQTSVQSSLGVQASIGFETAYGVVVPQAAVAWVHEYANSDRNIDARLVEAPAASTFTFQRERPARDWASIGLGVSALLPNRLQPFVQFATIQGNEHFVSYGGTAGVRLGL
jgi:outer membrane autotransporter protein